jgi:uncharacterized damage-inducible protein DinB
VRHVISEALRLSFTGPAWHGPALLDALDGVDAEMAIAHPVADAHSIWELTHHVMAWTREVTRRLRDTPAALPLEGDWPAAPPNDAPARDAAWEALRNELATARGDLLAAIDAISESRLAERVGVIAGAELGAHVTFRQMLLGLVQHDAYHGGQIVLLRRALEATR